MQINLGNLEEVLCRRGQQQQNTAYGYDKIPNLTQHTALKFETNQTKNKSNESFPIFIFKIYF